MVPILTPLPTPSPTPSPTPPQPQRASIDIKPGKYPNTINLGCGGVVPVAILTTKSFDASTVDPPTVIFASAPSRHSALEDVDDDGDLDLILRFECQHLNIDPDAQEASLSGHAYGGTSIWGCDSVSIVPP
ncbi:MAG: hypothetical protein Q8P22_11075 [Chloroflexota bacterium]|nr:hypothetical protein [Chloroflexota bacterium]